MSILIYKATHMLIHEWNEPSCLVSNGLQFDCSPC